MILNFEKNIICMWARVRGCIEPIVFLTVSHLKNASGGNGCGGRRGCCFLISWCGFPERVFLSEK